MTLTILERIGLDALVRQQKGTIEDLEVLLDIKHKLAVTPELRADLIVAVPGGVILNEKLISTIEPLDVVLEKSERKKLLQLITSWTQFGLEDLETWVASVKHKLEQ